VGASAISLHMGSRNSFLTCKQSLTYEEWYHELLDLYCLWGMAGRQLTGMCTGARLCQPCALPPGVRRHP
jgi:hypothetical protein